MCFLKTCKKFSRFSRFSWIAHGGLGGKKRVRNTYWIFLDCEQSLTACLPISNSEVNLDKTQGMQFLRFLGGKWKLETLESLDGIKKFKTDCYEGSQSTHNPKKSDFEDTNNGFEDDCSMYCVRKRWRNSAAQDVKINRTNWSKMKTIILIFFSWEVRSL